MFVGVCGRHKSGWEENKTLTQCGKYFRKKSIRANRHHSFCHVYLGYTQRECQTSKDIVDKCRNMFESRISTGTQEKLHYAEKFGANIFLMVL